MMMKSALFAIALLPLLAVTPEPASAHVNFRVYLGVPHYSYRVGPDYRFRRGYGWYRPGYRAGRVSCNQAASLVRRNGFKNISVRECSGSTYTFSATRNGNRTRVYVNSRSGAVWRG